MKNYVLGLVLVLSIMVGASQVHAAGFPGVDPSVKAVVCNTLTDTNLRYQATDALYNGQTSFLQAILRGRQHLDTAPVGYFGPLTEIAVKALQTTQGINIGGVADSYTNTAAYMLNCGNVAPSVSVCGTGDRFNSITGAPCTGTVTSNISQFVPANVFGGFSQMFGF